MNVNDFSVIHLFAITFASLGSSDFFQIMFYCFAPATHTVTCIQLHCYTFIYLPSSKSSHAITADFV